MMRIKSLLLENNMSQRDFAKALNCSQKAIDCWEKETSIPSANFIVTIANLFECTTDYVLGRENDFGQININSDLDSEERNLLCSFSKIRTRCKRRIIPFY